jgi:hypothetical protein
LQWVKTHSPFLTVVWIAIPVNIGSMKRGLLRAAIVLILTFTAMAVWGEGVEKHSTMRNERLSVLTSGVVEFTADDGTKLTVTVSKNGDLRIGNSFELSVRRTAGDERETGTLSE